MTKKELDYSAYYLYDGRLWQYTTASLAFTTAYSHTWGFYNLESVSNSGEFTLHATPLDLIKLEGDKEILELLYG